MDIMPSASPLAATFIDGSSIFKLPEQEAAEARAARALGQYWRCEFHSFGRLAAIDWFCVRHQKMVALAEIAVVDASSTDHPEFLLSTKKWKALALGASRGQVPALLAVQFLDGLRWIGHDRINAARLETRGFRQGRGPGD